VLRWLRRIGLGLVGLIVGLTLSSLLYNAVSSGRERPAAALYAGPSVVVDGRRLTYRSWGSHGTPILLLGGFVEPAWAWHLVGPLLARGHRVVALDLPPFGYSQRRGPYTLAAWIGLAHDFAAALGLRRPLVVGHSLGAAVAVGEALARPKQIAGIVLLDGDALALGGGARWVSLLAVPPYYTSIYRIASGSDWIVKRILRSAWGPNPPRFDAATLAEWKRPFRADGTAEAFRQLLAHGIPGYRLADLRRVRVPRAVVWGAFDTVDAVGAGRRSAAALGTRFTLVPQAGHLSMLANPAGVAAAIERAAATSARTNAAH
jgi:pimeloyl-ACP methyl ester carboxylesterase